MKNPIGEQIGIINELIELGKKQGNKIDEKGRSDLYFPDKELVNTILSTEKAYITVFWNIINFLNEKIESEKEEYFSYYFPLTRSLTEIYVKLVYFVCQDNKIKYNIFIVQTLFQLSKRYRDTMGKNKSELVRQYEKYYKEYRADFLKLPPNINNFSQRCLKRSPFKYPNIKDIIENDLKIDEVALITKKVFPKLTSDKIYNLYYRVPSDYLHGEIYSLIKSGKQQNEKFWMIHYCTVLSFLFIELVDKKILKGETEKELKSKAEKFKKNKTDFIDLWKIRISGDNSSGDEF